MALIVSEYPQYVLLQWAADRLDVPGGRWVEGTRALGVLDGVHIRAVLILNQFTAEGCEASFVSDGTKTWATRKTTSELIAYPFSRFGIDRLVAKVAADNRDTLIAALRIGFQFEGRERRGMWDGRDAIRLSMFRDEMPFAEGDF